MDPIAFFAIEAFLIGFFVVGYLLYRRRRPNGDAEAGDTEGGQRRR